MLLLIGNFVFYAFWDIRFLLLLFFISLLNYYLGLRIASTSKEKLKKLFLYIGILIGLGSLLLFKYLNFLSISFHNLLEVFSIHSNAHTFNLILPLGISFFTFRTISYLLDVEKGKTEAVKNWVVFFSYVSFFPSLISGPIDKTKTLVPQLQNKRTFKYDEATDGLRQILWGLFKKVVIADNCASITNNIFENSSALSSSTLIVGACLYSIQIYADFSGYSDMAIGIARLIGFNITKNFEYPFFAQNIAEFWRKWHISLTGWLTEYVFTPLSIAFRDFNKFGLILSIVINFTIVGIWHGASWTFVLFGFIHGCFYIPLILRNKLNKKIKIEKGKKLPSLTEFLNMILTFLLVSLCFVLFKSKDLSQAFEYYRNIFSLDFFTIPQIADKATFMFLMFFILILLSTEWFQRENPHGLHISQNSSHKIVLIAKNKALRWAIYSFFVISILGFSGNEQDFIYFRF